MDANQAMIYLLGILGLAGYELPVGAKKCIVLTWGHLPTARGQVFDLFRNMYEVFIPGGEPVGPRQCRLVERWGWKVDMELIRQKTMSE